jgi:hypothetical protein
MKLQESVKWFLAVEFNIIDATEEQINLAIEEGISNCGGIEEYEQEIAEWCAWHHIDGAWNRLVDLSIGKVNVDPPSSIENDFDSLNTFAVANPELCLKAMQSVTHMEDGLYIYLNAVTNEVEVFFEGEFMGEIAIKDGGIRVDDANFNFLDKACDHIASFFPGVWQS